MSLLAPEALSLLLLLAFLLLGLYRRRPKARLPLSLIHISEPTRPY